MNHSLYRQRFFKRPGFLSAIHGFFSRTGKASTGIVTAGQGQVIREGNILKIEQSSREMIVTWQDFNLGPDESVHIHQPDTTAIALIRVTGAKGSKLMGRVRANGQVFLVNENGILIGEVAEINAAGLVVSTLGLSDADFQTGGRTFSGENVAGVTSLGTLRAADGGYVALLGQQVNNHGTITANLGSVALVAASQVALKLAGAALLDATVEKAACGALAENQGHVQADGGHVLMRASVVDAPLNTVVRNEGVIRAQTVDHLEGVIRLLGGEEGVTVVNGILDASAPEKGNGGRVETCGAHVKIMDAARIMTLAITGKSGQWAIDPPDFTVAPSGGDITGSALSAQLATTNVTLQSSQGTVNPNGSGNLYINDQVNWGANTTLTLEAVNDININSPILALGSSAGLVLTPGSGRYNLGPGATIIVSSPTAHLNIAGSNYTVITDIDALQKIPVNSSGHYALGIDLDAAATSNWNGGAGFTPIITFRGGFDGLGHIISNLVINRPIANSTGLFAQNYGRITNLGFRNSSITGELSVGTLVGYNSTGYISNCFAVGTVTGSSNDVGGLVGTNDTNGIIENSYADVLVHGSGGFGYVGGLVGHTYGTVNNCHATGLVSGPDYVGGLVGYAGSGTINKCFATGAVSGGSYTGGLAGYNAKATINNSYATGAVSGQSYIGGLSGYNYLGTISNCFASGNVSGGVFLGGLVGRQGGGTINTSYATGNVTGTGSNVGGLVGYNDSNSSINNTYAAGTISGDGNRGGLVGYNDGAINASYAIGNVPSGERSVGGLVGYGVGRINNSYWDVQTTGQAVVKRV